jgi:hypothetical protein
MTAEQKTSQRDQPAFDMAACMAMMEKMMAGHGEGCDCEEMLSQIKSEGGIPDEWLKMISQMMGVHCRSQEVSKTKSPES